MLKIIVIVLFTLTTTTCLAQTNLDGGYQLVEDDLGIFVEKFDPSNVDEERFTRNNKTFPAGRQFTYHYYYENTLGTKYFYEPDDVQAEFGKSWKFVAMDKVTLNTVTTVVLTVKNGLQPFIQQMPDYNQTIIQFDYQTKGGRLTTNEVTGLIENEKNTWMHPPQTDLFRLLELNPFPYIRMPCRIGTRWSWALTIGPHWGDARWKTWTGKIYNTYTYQVTGKQKISTSAGDIECFVIEAKANSEIGQTGLMAYYSQQFGFVKLEYTNIDATKIVLELQQVK